MMRLDSREDELWGKIRFDKDATVDQLRLWCKKLNQLLLEKRTNEASCEGLKA